MLLKESILKKKGLFNFNKITCQYLCLCHTARSDTSASLLGKDNGVGPGDEDCDTNNLASNLTFQKRCQHSSNVGFGVLLKLAEAKGPPPTN